MSKSILKSKGPLIYATIVSLVCVMSCAVSTFAWFQAQANVQIQTSTSNTTISVKKPKDYIFYGYNGNTDHSWTDTEAFGTDFTVISSSNSTAKTNFTGGVGAAGKFNPGDVKAFAIKFYDHESGDNVSLKVSKLISNSINDQDPDKHRYHKGSPNVEINIGWAINIYSTYVGGDSISYSDYSTFVSSPSGGTVAAVAGSPLASGSVFVSGTKYYTRTASRAGAGYLNDGTYKYTLNRTGDGSSKADSANKYYPLVTEGASETDRFNYSYSSGDHTVSTSPVYHGSSSSNFNESTREITLNSQIDIFPETNKTDSIGYVFFTVAFDNVNTALKYKESSLSSDDALLLPSTDDDRYFTYNSSGASSPEWNSNCFSDLKFALTNIAFDW